MASNNNGSTMGNECAFCVFAQDLEKMARHQQLRGSRDLFP